MSTDQPTSRSNSRAHSRPTTPLRSSSRESLRRSSNQAATSYDALIPSFEELDDALAQLNDNFYALQQMHESIAKFNENFSSMLYGLNMNAFCVDFVETPLPESFARRREEEEAYDRANPGHAHLHEQQQQQQHHQHERRREYDVETTFMTNDTFVEQPSAPPVGNNPKTPMRGNRGGARGGAPAASGTRGGRGGLQAGRTRGSGIARGRGGTGRGTTR